MKFKTKLFITVFVFLQAYSFSQRNANTATYFTNIGIKAGYGLSAIVNKNMTNDNAIDYNSFSQSYNYGLTANISYIGLKPKNLIFAIQAEYLRNNFAINFNDIKTESGLNYSKTVNYIADNKILLLYLENVRLNMFVGVGFNTSYFISVTEINSIKNSDFFSQNEQYNLINFYHNYNSLLFDYGFNFHNFLIGLRFSIPVKNINKQERSPIYDGVYNNLNINSAYTQKYASNSNTYQYSLQLTVMYQIPFISIGRATSGKDGISIFKRVKKDYYWFQ